MGAPDLLQHLFAAGFRIDADGDKLTIKPASELTDEQRQQVRAHKTELLALLATDPDRWCWPHSEAMNSGEIATFTERVDQSIRRGMTEAQAEALADDMVQRDRHPDDWREAFEERAAIMEFDGGLSRDDAEAEARACLTCEFQSRRKTCLEPVLAGLAPHFSIRFTKHAPDAGAACVAYRGKS